MKLNFIVSNQTNPYWNVAVENYFVSQPDQGNIVLYLWKNHRTVVIGQNQNPFSECNIEALNNDGGYVMRRTTGGGAVYHDDGNINFSFIAPYNLYDQTLQFEVIRRALLSFGIECQLSGRNDILCQGRKFSGNAFSKGRHQRLHHGTILIRGNLDDLQRYLKPKPAKLHKHGVSSVSSRVVNLSELAPVDSSNIIPALHDAFENVYGQEATTIDFHDIMKESQVIELYNHFSSPDWIYGHWSSFVANKKGQFDWGEVEISISVDESKDIITDVEIATDALDTSITEKIRNILVNSSTTQPPVIDKMSENSKAIEDIISLIF
ncbi:MAG: lipoate--protein ligase [Bacteroidales bacterium]|nr:lipoate--protein ligase [Bacteroidales bacterium]